MHPRRKYCGSLQPVAICVKRRDAVAHRGAGVFQAWLRLRNACRPSEATHVQALVCAERRCTADLQCLSSGPHSAATAQITLASDVRTRFVPAGSAASTALHLATWPQIFSARHTSSHVDDCALRLHQRSSLHALCVLPLATAPFQRLMHRSGTVCRSQSGYRCRCKFSAADWKPNFLPGLTDMTRPVSKNESER